MDRMKDDGDLILDGHRVKFFEQSVTFIAQLETAADMVPPLNKDWLIGQWRIPETYIPIVVGISLGILVLLCTLTVIVIWRCCQYPSKHREKSYEMHKSRQDTTTPVMSPSLTSIQSNYPSILVTPMVTKLASTGSHGQLVSGTDSATVHLVVETPSSKRKIAGDKVDGKRHSVDAMSQVGQGCYVGFDLPEIPDSLNASSCASSSVLDQTGARNTGQWAADCGRVLSGDDDLKTRSLPSWARSKNPRSATDYHDKVKGPSMTSTVAPKRQHGLRHDAAALIAMSKSKSNTSSAGQDRVSLVNSEAVIVFDERTAL